MDDQQSGIDLSGLHRELDTMKRQLCRCGHRGECISCKGFEMLREQAQMVVAAASQPVLMQVAQEAAVKDLMGQMGGLQEKLGQDPKLQELMGSIMERVQEDLGGPEEMEKLMRSLLPGMMPGGEGPATGAAPGESPPRRAYDDIPPEERPGPRPAKGPATD